MKIATIISLLCIINPFLNIWIFYLSNTANTALRFGNQLASPYGRFLLGQKGPSQGRQGPYMTTATFFLQKAIPYFHTLWIPLV